MNSSSLAGHCTALSEGQQKVSLEFQPWNGSHRSRSCSPVGVPGPAPLAGISGSEKAQGPCAVPL